MDQSIAGLLRIREESLKDPNGQARVQRIDVILENERDSIIANLHRLREEALKDPNGQVHVQRINTILEQHRAPLPAGTKEMYEEALQSFETDNPANYNKKFLDSLQSLLIPLPCSLKGALILIII